jgi:dihydrofolate synthase/folylpolyglutamate synthase
MSYEAAITSMYALGHELAQTPSHKFDLAHMRVLLAALGNPEQRSPGVLIAGTNGKGSTAAALGSILCASALKTGLYTSPHLISINERIRVNGDSISDEDFTALHDLVDHTAERLVSQGELPWHPSFFEMLTAIAFEHFARERVDLAVLEVGMGGRLDATNVIEPRVSVITDISLDHQKYLGNTISEIAREKVGIIRARGMVVTLPQQPEANDVIGNAILELGAQAVSAVPYVPPVSPASAQYAVPGGLNEPRMSGSLTRAGRVEDPSPHCPGSEMSRGYVSRYPLLVMGKQIEVETSLVGRHQLRNVALAIATAEELKKQGFCGITPDSIERGIRQTQWPGRFQVIPPKDGEPEYVFDVAHNPAGAWALRSTLSAIYFSSSELSSHEKGRPLTFIFGAMRDKAIAEMAEILFPLAERVIATRAQNPRSATPDEIRRAASRISIEIEGTPDVASALRRGRALAGPLGLVVITGSIYIVGEAMRLLGVRI